MGPGTRLRMYLESKGIKAQERRCKCKQTMRAMDRVGYKKIRRNIDYWEEVTKQSARAWFKNEQVRGRWHKVAIKPIAMLRIRALILWVCDECEREELAEHGTTVD